MTSDLNELSVLRKREIETTHGWDLVYHLFYDLCELDVKTTTTPRHQRTPCKADWKIDILLTSELLSRFLYNL